ncbi:protein FAR1-RELATED SEQUENCE 5-like [Argentina anserina]|uniref:protein FAR1-RELATED SEQUENCE 5-like n=1 Tax=Argentina anserina TaxID=57926 RepID=UPI002176777D|nr:protein FAR1-RELATED SEQUENCE 5-like [Potentilla anserina]
MYESALRKDTVVQMTLLEKSMCYKQGKYEKKRDDKGIRSRGVVRCGYEAKIAVLQVGQSSIYIVSNFVEEHNHLLFLPKELSLVNIPPHKQFGILEVQAGGIQNIGCTKTDLYNYARDIRREYKGHDAKMVYEHFICEKSKNDPFYIKMKANDNDKLTHCFWADAKSRSSYKAYGDAIVFNNHGQTIVFGCGFLNKETTESFLWLLEQFKDTMSADPPNIFITDQDPAMGRPLLKLFLVHFTDFCIWHIMNKFSVKISACAHKDSLSELEKCVWDLDTKEELDSQWMEIIDRRKLHDND